MGTRLKDSSESWSLRDMISLEMDRSPTEGDAARSIEAATAVWAANDISLIVGVIMLKGLTSGGRESLSRNCYASC